MITIERAAVATGAPRAFALDDGRSIIVTEVDGTYYATEERCPHRGARFVNGEVEDGYLVCPLHHFKFALATGRCLMPRHLRIRTFAVVVEGDILRIDVPPVEPEIQPESEPDPAPAQPTGPTHL